MNRVAKWDNAKAILIYCVVLGHFVAAYQDKAAVYRSVFFFLYLFHMPGFFLISGLFSKRFANEERLNGRKFVPLLILCLVGIFLRFLSRVIFTKASIKVFDMSGASWFLFTLAVCYLLTWLVHKIDVVYVLVISIMTGCIVCYDKTLSSYFAVYRIVTFFPFFYLGYILDEQKFRNALDRLPVRLISAAGLLIFAFLCWKHPGVWRFKKLITGANHYYTMKFPITAWTWVYKVLYYAAALIAVLAVLSIVPSKKVPLMTAVGGKTLTIFLLHFFFIEICKRIPWFKAIALGQHHVPALLLFAGTSLLVVLFLSIPVFSIPFQWILHPKERKERQS